MTRPTILDLDLVVVPQAMTPEMIAAAWSAWHSRHGGKIGPGPAFGEAVPAAISASPYPTAWDDVRKYVEGLERENATAYELIGKTGLAPYIALKDRAEAAEARIAELEKRLADAERVIEPFAERAGKLDGIWKDHETQWSPEYGNTAITIGHLRAARAYMEGK